MCTRKYQDKIENQFNFWNDMPVDKIFHLNLVWCVKYFDANRR